MTIGRLIELPRAPWSWSSAAAMPPIAAFWRLRPDAKGGGPLLREIKRIRAKLHSVHDQGHRAHRPQGDGPWDCGK